MNLDAFVLKASKNLSTYEEPLRYLKKRGITEEDISKYSIGYTKVVRIENDGSSDYKSLHEHTSGFRRLQGRILFPLRNILGGVNGLQARALDKKQYIQYFLGEAKSIGAFFGIKEALPHIKRTRKVFVHEGALDCVSFAKVIPNSISSLTSFLNEQQYELLALLADKIILVYDQDNAGDHGVKKVLEYYGTQHIEELCIGEGDSNSYLQTMGFLNFEKFIKARVPKILQN